MMKKWWTWVLVPLLLAGCAAEPVWETIEDDMAEPVLAKEPMEITLTLPEEAAAPVLQQEDGSRVYLTDSCEIRVETLPAGNLNGTLQELTGQDRNDLTVLSTKQDAFARYDCAWTAAGEEGQQAARTAVLDDGSYHYCLTVLWDAAQTADVQNQVNQVFAGFSLQ